MTAAFCVQIFKITVIRSESELDTVCFLGRTDLSSIPRTDRELDLSFRGGVRSLPPLPPVPPLAGRGRSPAAALWAGKTHGCKSERSPHDKATARLETRNGARAVCLF